MIGLIRVRRVDVGDRVGDVLPADRASPGALRKECHLWDTG